MKGVTTVRLKCGTKNIKLRLDSSEKNSMLVVGGSRAGKTFFASNFAADLITEGYQVHLIDLGDKWSHSDKKRLRLAGAQIVQVEQQGIELVFQNKKDLIDCARHIVNPLNIKSEAAKAVLKNIIKKLAAKDNASFQFSNIISSLRGDNQDTQDKSEWSEKLADRLDGYGEIPDIRFTVDQNAIFSSRSTIWDLSGLDETYVKISTYLLLYCLFCQQRNYFRRDAFNTSSFFEQNDLKVFVVIDEFQNLDCDRHAIIGTCLTEGQKYKLALILLTQFLSNNFSEAVISQFKQGGYRFYFRLTEEEAWNVSRQLIYEIAKRKDLAQKLAHLPVGNCLMLGAHSLENRTNISEDFRIVQIEEELNCVRRGTVYAPR